MAQKLFVALLIFACCCGCSQPDSHAFSTVPPALQATVTALPRQDPSPTPSAVAVPTVIPTATELIQAPTLAATELVQAPQSLAAPISSISFVDQQNGWMAVDDHVLITTDGGLQWSRVYTASAPIGLAFTTPQDGWATMAGGLFITHDHGRTWQAVAGPAGDAKQLRFGDSQTGIVYSSTGVYLTVDAGATWSPLTQPCGEGESSGPPDVRTNGQIWMICPIIGLAGYRPNNLYASSEHGATWTKVFDSDLDPSRADAIPAGGFACSLSFSDLLDGRVITGNYLYHNGDGHYGYLSHSSDGGKSWSIVETAPLGEYLELSFTSPDWGYLVAHTTKDTVLYRTTDGSATWQSIYRADPGEAVR